MKGFLRWLGIIASGIVVLVVLAAGVVFALSESRLDRRYPPRAESLPAPSEPLVSASPRRAILLGCVSCHGEGLRGKLMADIPGVVRLHAPNLTRAAANATDQQLAQSIRQGIGPDGRGLLVMPAYPHLNDDETASFIAWLRSQPVVDGEEEGVSIGPVGRVAISTGRLFPIASIPESQRLQLPADVGAGHGEGRRLASLICAICHGPTLRGQPTQEGAKAPDLVIAVAYDTAQFRTLMRTGKGLSDRNLGEMANVARDALFALTDEEIDALHAYLVERAKQSGP